MMRRLTDPFPGRCYWGGFGGFAARGVVQAQGGGADVTAPTLASATVSSTGYVLDLVYDEGLDTGSTPATGDFAVAGTNATLSTVTHVTTSVANDTIRLTFDGAALPVTGIQTVTISYTAGVNPIQDAAGNNAANLSSQAVTNDSTVAAPFGVSGLILYAWADGAVTLDGSSNVSDLVDESDASNDLGQANASLRPSDPTIWRNGRKAFDFSSVYLETPAGFSGGLIAQATHFAAAAMSASNRLCDGTTADRHIIGINGGDLNMFAGSWTSSGISVAADTPVIIEAFFSDTAGSSSMRVEPHGGAVQTATGLTTGENEFDGMRWGATNSTTTWGKPAALHLVYSGDVPSADRADIRAWISAEYDIVHT
jgi:hypothetical protein